MTENTDQYLHGIKWEILQELSKKPSSPRQLGDILGTTIANISQQLKLLEAYGYLKSKRVDKGKGSRKKSNSRIIYSIIRSQTIITQIQPNLVVKEEIKQSHLHNYLIRTMLIDTKEASELLIKFYIDYQDIIDEIDALFYIKTDGNEVHLLVITENLEKFRGKHSHIDVWKEKPGKIVFWSHNFEEFGDGLKRKEKYFLDQIKKVQLLYEKKPYFATQLMEGSDE